MSLGGAGVDLMIILESSAKPHRVFSRDGADLRATLQVPAWQNARWWRRPVSMRSICGRCGRGSPFLTASYALGGSGRDLGGIWAGSEQIKDGS